MRKLNYKAFVKAGREVTTTVYSFTPLSVLGRKVTAVIIDGKKFTPAGKETTRFYSNARVKIKYEIYSNRKRREIEDFACLGDLQPVRKVAECNFRDLQKIFLEIGWGSIYISDYKNSLQIDPYDLENYCENYIEAVSEEHPDDWEKHINAKDFACYCFGVGV